MGPPPAGGPYGPWGPQPPMPPQGSGNGPLLAILLAAAFVLVLIAGGAVAWALWPSDPETVVLPSPSPSASATTSVPTVSAVPAGTVPEAFGGTWKGDLSTSSGSWSVSITLAKGTTIGTTQYYSGGSAKCSGTIRMLEGSDDLLTLQESTPTCDESTSGYVTLSRTGDRVLYKWYSTREKMDSGRLGYSGTLDRQ